MKACLTRLAGGIFVALGLGFESAQAELEITTSARIATTADFYAPLSPYGSWIEVESYGRCWRPTGVARDWRPYCSGYWVWTECGWYWMSDEPWAWACYHYGWWVQHPSDAWIWIPGIEWGPAWVSWRWGDVYIGWAPLPPRQLHAKVAPAPYVFVETSRFHETVSPSTIIVNNAAIVKSTTEISNPRSEMRALANGSPQKVLVNEGPGLDPLQKATGKKIRITSLQEAVRQTPVPSAVRRDPGEFKGRVLPPAQTTPPVPATSLAPDKAKPPVGNEIIQPPARPPTPPAPPIKPSKPSKGESPGKDD
jgi:hypothetical protein